MQTLNPTHLALQLLVTSHTPERTLTLTHRTGTHFSSTHHTPHPWHTHRDLHQCMYVNIEGGYFCYNSLIRTVYTHKCMHTVYTYTCTRTNAYTHICIHVKMFTRTNVYAHKCTRINVYTHECKHVQMYTRANVYAPFTRTHAHVQMHIRTYVYTYKCKHVQMYIRTNVYTYKCIRTVYTYK
jgi:hypothetical protein